MSSRSHRFSNLFHRDKGKQPASGSSKEQGFSHTTYTLVLVSEFPPIIEPNRPHNLIFKIHSSESRPIPPLNGHAQTTISLGAPRHRSRRGMAPMTLDAEVSYHSLRQPTRHIGAGEYIILTITASQVPTFEIVVGLQWSNRGRRYMAAGEVGAWRRNFAADPIRQQYGNYTDWEVAALTDLQGVGSRREAVTIQNS